MALTCVDFLRCNSHPATTPQPNNRELSWKASALIAASVAVGVFALLFEMSGGAAATVLTTMAICNAPVLAALIVAFLYRKHRESEAPPPAQTSEALPPPDLNTHIAQSLAILQQECQYLVDNFHEVTIAFNTVPLCKPNQREVERSNLVLTPLKATLLHATGGLALFQRLGFSFKEGEYKARVELLREAEERFQALREANAGGTVIAIAKEELDLAHGALNAYVRFMGQPPHQAAEPRFGTGVKEKIDQRVAQLRSEREKCLAKLETGASQDAYRDYFKKDGAYQEMRYISIAGYDSAESNYLTFAKDLANSKHKYIEESLKGTEGPLKAALEEELSMYMVEYYRAEGALEALTAMAKETGGT